MLTVARLTAHATSQARLLDTGHAMNTIRQGAFTGLGHRGQHFSCDVHDGPRWADHDHAIRVFLADFGDLLQGAIAAGIHVSIDVAVWPEDRAAAVALVGLAFAPDLLRALGAAEIALLVSSYV